MFGVKAAHWLKIVHSDTAVGMHIYKPRDKAVSARINISDIYIVGDFLNFTVLYFKSPPIRAL